jgi:hypothetical protein
MTSNIDPTVPTEGIAYTVDVRTNFATAKAEIEALQGFEGAGPFLPIAGGAMQGTLLLAADVPLTDTEASSKFYVDNHVVDGGNF